MGEENTQGIAERAPRGRPAEKSAGVMLCLSGGGFRATLFHLGAVRRLNELGVLAKVDVITSVSGGSILNGILATRWGRLRRTPVGVLAGFDDAVADPARAFCSRDLRTDLLFGIRINPENWPLLMRDYLSVRANFLAEAYEELYEERWLSELPAPRPNACPRFVFCATSMQTGACWHFHSGPSGRMGDFYTGYMKTGKTTVAQAVAASSAFPPGFGSLRLPIPFPDALSREDPWGNIRDASPKRGCLPLGKRAEVLLTDGGVYDNLGVEPVWDQFRSLLVSDAGHPFASETTACQALIPRLKRAAEISMEQVGGVRKRWFISNIERRIAQGTIWTINTPIEGLRSAQGYDQESRALLSTVRTDLNSFSIGEMRCLENHGYSIADAAIRSWSLGLCPIPNAPFKFPHPEFSSDVICQRELCRSSDRTLIRDICRYIIKGVKQDWVSPILRLFRPSRSK